MVPASALNTGPKVPLSRSYTHKVYCGGARVTFAPEVFDEVQRLVVLGLTVVSRTRQGDQLTSMRFVPSYRGNTEAKRPPKEGMFASVVTPRLVRLVCAVPEAPEGAAGWWVSTKPFASICTMSPPSCVPRNGRTIETSVPFASSRAFKN